MSRFLIKSKLGKYWVTVDDNDDWVFDIYKWHIHKSVPRNKKTVAYYVRNSKLKTSLHRFLMNCPKGLTVDHINQNPLDNRKSNLRIATQKENLRNVKKYSNNSSGYKGVHYRTDSKTYRVKIEVEGRQIYGGYFKNIGDAALKYNQLAKKYFGDFASLNEIKESDLENCSFDLERKVKSSSGYIGVESYKTKSGIRHKVAIRKDDIRYRYGSYDDIIEAAKKYNEEAIRLFGDKARLNKL